MAVIPDFPEELVRHVGWRSLFVVLATGTCETVATRGYPCLRPLAMQISPFTGVGYGTGTAQHRL